MPECELIDVVGLPEFFLDGFTNYIMMDGILRCTGYRKQFSEGRIVRMPAFNLQITPDGAISARAQAANALQSVGMPPHRHRPRNGMLS